MRREKWKTEKPFIGWQRHESIAINYWKKPTVKLNETNVNVHGIDVKMDEHMSLSIIFNYYDYGS